jgi:glycosyltransferase involved in cell wall biosynthesis
MKISLIITTYNWNEALNLVFKSVAGQVALPDEIIVADDGSTPATAALVDEWRLRLPIPVIHVWQHDRGFRLARARNRAIARARGDYIVLIDGDMVLHPHFIDDHRKAARRGYFMQGVRLITNQAAANKILNEETLGFGFFARGIQRRHHTVRSRFLSWLLLQPTHTHQKAIRGSNQAYWKDDLVRVNGFNEEMIGWGGEDNDIAARLYNAGVRRKNLKFAALATHLYHPSRRPVGDNPNHLLLRQTIENKATRCVHGLDRHLLDRDWSDEVTPEPAERVVGGN